MPHDSTQVTISCTHITPTRGQRNLLALATAEITISGIPITIHGIQVFADSAGTNVRLPKYRAPDGTWVPAIGLPEEVKGPLADTVMAAGIEAGILRSRVG